MEFSRQEYLSGLPYPSLGDLSYQGSNPGLPNCRQILYCLSHQGSPFNSPYSIGNYIQYLVINHNEKDVKKKRAYICITESLCCIADSNTTLSINYTKKKKRNLHLQYLSLLTLCPHRFGGEAEGPERRIKGRTTRS